MRDGSGLSHENRVTAEQVAQLLVTMRGHRHGARFINSLAQPGEDGTLRRYKGTALLGRLRGKTGTISGARALAGYVDRPDATTLAFALLVNGSVSHAFLLEVAEVLAEAGLDAGS